MIGDHSSDKLIAALNVCRRPDAPIATPAALMPICESKPDIRIGRFLIWIGAVALVVVSLTTSQSALADTTVAGWSLTTVPNGCVAAASFTHRTTGAKSGLGFGLFTSGRAYVAIIDWQWKIPLGPYTIQWWVDNSTPQTFDATAVETDMIRWFYKMSKESFTMLSRGKVMYVQVGRKQYSFSLSGSAAMLPALLRCTAEVAREANPFSDQDGDPSNPFSGVSDHGRRQPETVPVQDERAAP